MTKSAGRLYRIRWISWLGPWSIHASHGGHCSLNRGVLQREGNVPNAGKQFDRKILALGLENLCETFGVEHLVVLTSYQAKWLPDRTYI
jgi:hypothetical protein